MSKLSEMKAKTAPAKTVKEHVETEGQGKAPVELKGRDKKLSTYTTVATWKALQQQRIDEERSVNDIVNDAIQMYLKSVGGPEKK